MDQARVQEIMDRWVMPTEESSYMGGLEKRPILAAAHGSTVVDTQGKEYLDFQSGQMGAALGHRHPRVMAAVRRATETFVHASNIMLNVPRLELHERLGHLLVPPLQKSLFLVTGSDTIEASVDLARKATGGLDILGLHDGLHGSTSYISRSLSFAWTRQKHASIAPGTSAILTPHCYQCPVASTFPKCEFLCLKASMELADANFTSRPARDRGADPQRGRRHRAAAGVLPGRAAGLCGPRDAADLRRGPDRARQDGPDVRLSARGGRPRHHGAVEALRRRRAGECRVHDRGDRAARGGQRLFRHAVPRDGPAALRRRRRQPRRDRGGRPTGPCRLDRAADEGRLRGDGKSVV